LGHCLVAEFLVGLPMTTLWPCPSEYYEDGRALLQGYGTVKSLYDFESHSIAYIGDNPIALRAKAYALLDRATILLTQSKSLSRLDSNLQSKIRIANRSISTFGDFISTFQYVPLGLTDFQGVKVVMSSAVTAAHAAVVQIYNIPILAQADPGALNKQRIACKNTVSVVKEVAKLEDQYFPLALDVTLPPVYKFLVSQAKSQNQGSPQSTAPFDEDISVLAHTFMRQKGFLRAEDDAELDLRF